MAEEQPAGCDGYVGSINSLMRMWDKDGTRLAPLVDEAVAAVAACRLATDTKAAEAVLVIATKLSSWLDEHRSHIAEMADMVTTMRANSTLALSTGEWPMGCGKGEAGGGDPPTAALP